MGEAQKLIKEILAEAANLEVVQGLAQEYREKRRADLIKAVCHHFDFVNAKGDMQQSCCREALVSLEKAGKIELPPGEKRPRKTQKTRTLKGVVPEPQGVPATVQEVTGLELVQAREKNDILIWNTLMNAEHNRGAVIRGERVYYLIKSDYGYLGAMSFSSASIALKDRDNFIGWDSITRKRNLNHVVTMSRFLIRKSVKCENLASKVIGMALRRIENDFYLTTKHKVYIVETFVDDNEFHGTSYLATNWIEVGETVGRGRNDVNHKSKLTKKKIYLYIIEKRFRDILCTTYTDPYPALDPIEGLDIDEWAENEYSGCKFNKGSVKRLIEIATLMAKKPTKSFCKAAYGDRAKIAGYYRFIQNKSEKINHKTMIIGHKDQTIRRSKSQTRILAIEDGTTYNFSSHIKCDGLGRIGANQTNAKILGIYQHATIATTTDGMPLGILNLDIDTPIEREEDDDKKIPLEERKSYYWHKHFLELVKIKKLLPNTEIINVCDREAAIFDLFKLQKEKKSVHLLVRVKEKRKLIDGTELCDTVKNIEKIGEIEIDILRQSERPRYKGKEAKEAKAGRKAILSIRVKEVEISDTDKKRNSDDIRLTLIHAKEENPPQGVDCIEWFLFSTKKITTFEEAKECIKYYETRWIVEEWHRVIKTGLSAEYLENRSIERIGRVIAIKLVIAWRIMLMTYLGRDMSDLEPDIFFNEIEIDTLKIVATKEKLPLPVDLGKAVYIVAKLGGYQGGSSSLPPGHDALWTGYSELETMCYINSVKTEQIKKIVEENNLSDKGYI